MHTPGPYYRLSGGSDDHGRKTDIVSNTVGPHWPSPDHWVGEFSYQNPENAEFIVRACNSHDDLLAACNAVLETLENCKENDNPTEALALFSRDMRVTLRLAIAKAERGH